MLLCSVHAAYSKEVFQQYEENPLFLSVNVGLSHVTGKDKRDKAIGVALCFRCEHELPGKPACPALGFLVGNADKTIFS